MLLLDEPSNALDLAAQQDLREMLRRLAQRGTAILLITHHIADILPEIDRIVMMNAGESLRMGAKKTFSRRTSWERYSGARSRLIQRDGYWNAW